MKLTPERLDELEREISEQVRGLDPHCVSALPADVITALISMARASLWRPISEAPKGKLLLYHPKTGAGNSELPAMVKVDHFPVTYPRKPTHYMPLPEPPE